MYNLKKKKKIGGCHSLKTAVQKSNDYFGEVDCFEDLFIQIKARPAGSSSEWGDWEGGGRRKRISSLSTLRQFGPLFSLSWNNKKTTIKPYKFTHSTSYVSTVRTR